MVDLQTFFWWQGFNWCHRYRAEDRKGELPADITSMFCKGREGKVADSLWRFNVKGEVGYPEMFDCSRNASQAFQLCWIKGTSQETSAPHKIIQAVTNPAQKTRMGFYFSNANPAVEKFIARKDIAEALLVLSSCWPTQTLHVFTTTFPLIFQSLASRTWTWLSSSLQETVQRKEPSTWTVCGFLPGWRLPCPPVALVSDPAVPGVHVLWSR